MRVANKLPGYRWFSFLTNVPIRIGIYTGVCLAVVFAGWLVVANRIPFFESEALAFGRNLCAELLLILIACIPVVRFRRHPAEMLGSALLGWTLFSVAYRLLCLEFTLLNETYSTFEIFMIGSIVFLLIATIAWLGNIIQRVRASHISHPHH